MKFFIDTANVDEIKEINEWGVLSGVTTNPSLIAKSGRVFEEVVEEIASIVEGPISAEVTATEAQKMIEQGRALSLIHKNIVVKIPMTAEGLKAVKVLSKEGISTNVTLVFSTTQGMLAAEAGATYISPFIGRLDDIGQDGMELISSLACILEHYGYSTQIIAASIRNLEHVKEAAEEGAHIATIPYKVFHEMIHHNLTDKGIQQFLEDFKSVSTKGDF